MKKRVVAVLLAGAMVMSMTACGNKSDSDSKEDGKVSLSVTTTFAGNDGNAKNYQNAVKEFEEANDIKIKDSSATSDEDFKARVATDFETGSEPDVLFFFTGADANSFVESEKVVSIEEIRKEYPEYADNMDETKMPTSPVDDKQYAVPANGIWEAMFYNKEILDEAGVTVPGADYTWDQFLSDCEKIKEAGYSPIAAALGEIPHYWWEYSIFNHTTPETHLEIPESADKGNGPAWVEGMEDIKELYEKGYFPENTNSAKDEETFQSFMDGKAAFLIDGSWKVNGIVAACQSDADDPSTLDADRLAKYGVCYVPAMDNRKATDIIGGMTSGYYITKKAWDDENKRDAAVKFVEAMTTDENVTLFTGVGSSALKTPQEPKDMNSLQQSAFDMYKGNTSLTLAVQDLFNAGDCRTSTFQGMPKIVTGEVDAKDAVDQGLKTYAEATAQ